MNNPDLIPKRDKLRNALATFEELVASTKAELDALETQLKPKTDYDKVCDYIRDLDEDQFKTIVSLCEIVDKKLDTDFSLVSGEDECWLTHIDDLVTHLKKIRGVE